MDSVDLPSDETLMLRTASGDRKAFEQLVDKYHGPLLNFFARLGVLSDGEDLVQNTMIKLYNARKRYRPSAKFSTYLFAIARRTWIDRGRKMARRERTADALREEMDSAADSRSDHIANRLDVQRALDALPEKLRMVVVMRIYQGMPYRDIAAVMHIPVGTAKSRMNTALHMMKGVLDE